MRKQKELLVLEALASEQNAVLRSSRAGWDEHSAELCHTVDEFVQSFAKYL